MDSFELLKALKNQGYIKEEREELWWPKSGTFEVVVGTILTQQTKWERVESSLTNLRDKNLLDLDSIADIDLTELALLIKPSGFYNTKAKNLKKLCQNIIQEFENFENFVLHVDRDWLLLQKGIGEESSDCILCYACFRDVMVVDSYTSDCVYIVANGLYSKGGSCSSFINTLSKREWNFKRRFKSSSRIHTLP